MKTRRARKIVRRTLRCFDNFHRLGRPGYKLITIIRANAIMRARPAAADARDV